LELLGLIEDYRQGLVPLIVPLTLLKHHLSRHPVPDWVHQQVYLHPYPKELMLRNHVSVQCLPYGRLRAASNQLIRCPFFSSSATRITGSVALLKGRDSDRMSIDSAKRPSWRCHGESPECANEERFSSHVLHVCLFRLIM
jgi:hypothetical protein